MFLPMVRIGYAFSGERLGAERGCSVERRRRVPRQVAGWTGKYCIEGEDAGAWHECHVLDISVIGVGIEMFGPVADPDRLVGQRVVVEANTPSGASLSVRTRGEVRNVRPGVQGGTRVGMEFVDLTDTERSILDALVAMGAMW